MAKKDIIQQILVDEEKLIENLVMKAKKIFGLDQKGNIRFLIPRDSLTQRQIVAIYLLGKYFAKELDINESDIATAEELSVLIGLDKQSITARLYDLRKEHIIESPARGQFCISISGADKILDEILTTLVN